MLRKCITTGVIFMVALLALAGCGNRNRTPRYDVPQPLEIETFKRKTRHGEVDYLHNFKQTAFSPVKEPLRRRLSPSQQDILTRHGQPDYIRKGWKSTSGETVDEWAWWDRSIVAQFVQRELVYEGPLTDMDRYRIRHGYPSKSYTQDYEVGAYREIWIYQHGLLDTRGSVVTFGDEKLISQQSF